MLVQISEMQSKLTESQARLADQLALAVGTPVGKDMEDQASAQAAELDLHNRTYSFKLAEMNGILLGLSLSAQFATHSHLFHLNDSFF